MATQARQNKQAPEPNKQAPGPNKEARGPIIVSISKRILISIAAGIMAGFSVAPFVTTVDKSIVQNASGACSMKQSIKASIRDLCTRPHQFVRRYEFALIFGVYSGTYQTANMIDTFYEQNPQFPVSKDIGKFIGVSSVNMTLGIYKDRCFVRYFGIIKPTSVPLRSYSLWALRDTMTIIASFNIPAFGSKYLHENHKEYFSTEKKAFLFCQLISPIFMQIFSTSFHLGGLDIYNHKQSTFKRRLLFIRREYIKSLLGRMARIFPAFSLGGLGNKYYRDMLNDYASK